MNKKHPFIQSTSNTHPPQQLQNTIIQINNQAMNLLQYGDLPQTLKYITQANQYILKLNSQTLQFKKLKALCLNTLACYYHHKKQNIEALKNINEAIELEKNINDNNLGLSRSYLNKCVILSEMNKHQQALQFANRALQILNKQIKLGIKIKSKNHKLTEVFAISFYNIAAEFQFLKNNIDAVQTYKKGYRLSRQLLGQKHPLSIMMRRNLKHLRYKSKQKIIMRIDHSDKKYITKTLDRSSEQLLPPKKKNNIQQLKLQFNNFSKDIQDNKTKNQTILYIDKLAISHRITNINSSKNREMKKEQLSDINYKNQSIIQKKNEFNSEIDTGCKLKIIQGIYITENKKKTNKNKLKTQGSILISNRQKRIPKNKFLKIENPVYCSVDINNYASDGPLTTNHEKQKKKTINNKKQAFNFILSPDNVNSTEKEVDKIKFPQIFPHTIHQQEKDKKLSQQKIQTKRKQINKQQCMLI